MQTVLDLEAPRPQHRVAYGPEREQFGDLFLPPGPAQGLVLALHGGFWRAKYDLSHLGHLCAALAKHGYATFSVEYARVGQPRGGWPGTFHDVARAADFLPELGRRFTLSTERPVVLGHSAGGHLALWLAARHALPRGNELASDHPFLFHGVVSLAGVTDLVEAHGLRLGSGAVEDLLGGPPERHPERYRLASPAALLPFGTKQVLVHGTEDEDVPYTLATRFLELARERGEAVQLRSLPAMGHFEPIDPRSLALTTVLGAIATARE
jgi:acetyl esterase/lipase